MKKILLFIITLYQVTISPILRQIIGMQNICRYSPSCSEYAKIVVGRYGVIKGSILTIKRLLSCQPWFHRKKI